MRKLRIVLKENKTKSILVERGILSGKTEQLADYLALENFLNSTTNEELKNQWQKVQQENEYKTGSPLGNTKAYLQFGQYMIDIQALLASSIPDYSFIADIITDHPSTKVFFQAYGSGGGVDYSSLNAEDISNLMVDYYKASVVPYMIKNLDDKIRSVDYAFATYFNTINSQIKPRFETLKYAVETSKSRQGSGLLAKFSKSLMGDGQDNVSQANVELKRLFASLITGLIAKKKEGDNLSKTIIKAATATPSTTTAPPEGGGGTATPPEGGGAGGGGEPPTTPPEGAGGSARPPAGTPIPVSTDLFRALSRSVPRWATAEIIRTLRSELGAAGYPLRESIKSSDSTLDILLKEEVNLLLETSPKKHSDDFRFSLGKVKTLAGIEKLQQMLDRAKKEARGYYQNPKELQQILDDKKKELGGTPSTPSAEPESSTSPTDSKPDTEATPEATPEAKDYFKELVVDKAPEKEAELDKMITQQKGMKEILRDYTLWLLKRKREAEDATKQKVGSPEFEKEAPKFFEKYSRMVTATRKLVQLFEDAESDREITDKRAVKMHVEAAFPKSAGFSNNIRELMETMLGERAGSAKDTRRDFQKAPSKGLVKDAGKAGKQVDLKKFQGFISSLRPPEGQKPLANKDAAVNIVRKFLSNYGIKLTESQTIRMINNLISESRYQTKVIKEYREHIQSQLIPYMQKQIGFNKPPVINFLDDTQNASDPFGKTAFYDPQSMEISVYTTGRHPKDIMRSVAHEVIHHAQNCRGQLDPQRMGEASEGYAQKNPYLRKLEEEAYLLGNMTFRDWEDGMKTNQLNEMHDCNKVHPNKSHAAYKREDKNSYKEISKPDYSEDEQEKPETYDKNKDTTSKPDYSEDEQEKPETLEEWRNNERWDLLMKRFKIVSEKRFANDPKLDKDGDGKPKWADEDDDNPEDSKKQVKGKK